MHMSDALLSPAVGGAMWAGTLGTIAYCSKKVRTEADDQVPPLMGVTGAFVFAAQMINFTIPGTGSSGHLAGGMLLAILLGPHAAFLVMASVLIIQALLFADGGLLALGCNIWNLGMYACFIAYPLIYAPLVRRHRTPGRILLASLASAIVALQLGAFSVVLETVVSGRSDISLGLFALLMQPIHLAIGAVEGVITAGVVNYVRKLQPEALVHTGMTRRVPGGRLKTLTLAFLFLALVTGGVFSWFASANPDGLEWALRRITGAAEIPEHTTGIGATLRALQAKLAILPDYTFKPDAPPKAEASRESLAWPHVDVGTTVAGMVGVAMMITLMFVVGVGIRALRKRAARG